MEVVYNDELTTLYYGNFYEGFDVCPNADLVLVDPPYGETSLEWDHWPIGWPALIAGAVKRNVSLWCWGSARMFWDHRDEFRDWCLCQDIVWDKSNGGGFRNDRFYRIHEYALMFRRPGVRWRDVYHSAQYTRGHRPYVRERKRTTNGIYGGGQGSCVSYSDGRRLVRSVIQTPSPRCGREGVFHNTQKSELITKYLVKYSCPPGGTVFDPFSGSATTLVCARREGRRAIGIESNAECCAKSVKRLLDDKR